jgi:hypothetical protein
MVRRWLLLLICLALPLQPPAFATQAQPPCCPMAAQMAAQLAAGELAAAELPACCNDAAAFALTGQTCPSGQECCLNSPVAVPISPVTRAVLPLDQAPPPAATAPWSPGSLASPWHPPRSL